MSDTLDRFRDWDAAYVLGALSTDDRRAFERHLSTCAECASSVADIAGVPGILSKLPVADAVALIDLPESTTADDRLRGHAHQPELVQRLARASARRRRRARLILGAAAAVVIALTAVGGVALGTSRSGPPQGIAMTALHQQVITATLAVTKKGWGTRFDWQCAYPGAYPGDGHSYDLVVTERTGAMTTVATWTSAGPKASGLSASSSIPTARIRSVEIRLSGTTTPLLRENVPASQ